MGDEKIQIPKNVYYLLSPENITDKKYEDIKKYINSNKFTAKLNFNDDYKNNGGYLDLKIGEASSNLNKYFCLFTIINSLLVRFIFNMCSDRNNDTLIEQFYVFWDRLEYYSTKPKELFETVTLNTKPIDNKRIVLEVICRNNLMYFLSFKRFLFGGIFSQDMPERVFECILILLAYINKSLVNYEDNEEFYKMVFLGIHLLKNIDYTDTLLCNGTILLSSYFMAKHAESTDVYER